MGLVVSITLPPSSGLPPIARAFYRGGSFGVLVSSLVWLARTQFLLRRPERWKETRIRETDERIRHINWEAIPAGRNSAGVPADRRRIFVGGGGLAAGGPAVGAHFGGYFCCSWWPAGGCPKKYEPPRLELPITGELAGIQGGYPAQAPPGSVRDGGAADQVAARRHPGGRRAGEYPLLSPGTGQVLSVRLSDPERRSGMVPAPGPLDIVYEDGDVVVLNKAPGVPVHPGPGHFSDTLGNFLLYHYDEEGEEGDFHPVHRLDRGTSGLLVVARHPHAQEVLKSQLHTPAFRREYLAVCQGAPEPPPPEWWTPPWGRSPAPWWSRWSVPTASPPAPGMRRWQRRRTAPWCGWCWTPAAPTRSGSTWPIWATPWWGTSSTARRSRQLIPRPALHS